VLIRSTHGRCPGAARGSGKSIVHHGSPSAAEPQKDSQPRKTQRGRAARRFLTTENAGQARRLHPKKTQCSQAEKRFLTTENTDGHGKESRMGFSLSVSVRVFRGYYLSLQAARHAKKSNVSRTERHGKEIRMGFSVPWPTVLLMKKVVSGGPARALASPRPMTALRIQSR